MSNDSELSPNEVVVVDKPKRPKIKRREVVDGKPKLGRPKKSDIEKKKKPGLIGRPPGSGDGARIAEFKARLLATSGDSIINKVVEIALTDGHPSQSAALKMCVDRVLPMSYFDKEKQGGVQLKSALTLQVLLTLL